MSAITCPENELPPPSGMGIVYSDCTIWKPRGVAPRKRDRGGGRNPGNKAQFKEIMTYTSAKLRGLIQLAVLGYLKHNG